MIVAGCPAGYALKDAAREGEAPEGEAGLIIRTPPQAEEDRRLQKQFTEAQNE